MNIRKWARFIGLGLVILLVATVRGAKGVDAVKSAAMDGNIFLPLVANNYESLPLFFDYFSYSCSGWAIIDQGIYEWSYQDSEYEVILRQASQGSGSLSPVVGPVNYSVEANIRIIMGSTGEYGLIFGFVNWNNYYVFLVNPINQSYSVWRHDPEWVKVIDWTISPIINTGNASNHLKVERDGIQISVFINGQLLAMVNDGTYMGSRTGTYGQFDSNVPVTMRFDNFEIGIQDISVCPGNVSLLSKTGEGVSDEAVSVQQTYYGMGSIPIK